MSTLTCKDLVTHLSAYLDGELDSNMEQAAKKHLATCENCSVVLHSTRQTIQLYQQHRNHMSIHSDRKQELLQSIQDALDMADT